MKNFLILLTALFSVSVALACDDDKPTGKTSSQNSHPALTLVSTTPAADGMQKATFEVKGMMCSHCQKKVEASLHKVDGVKTVSFQLKKHLAEVTYLTDRAKPEALLQAIKSGLDATETD